MRRLWIKRHKVSAGAAKMNIYIEDPEKGDITINDTPCRKLGEIKNGQQKHFTISEDAAKVFVAAGKISRKRSYVPARLSEGREDVFLSGRDYHKTFRFDDMQEEEAPSEKKRGSRVGTVVLVIAILLGIVAGLVVGRMVGDALLNGTQKTETAKTFACQGMEITLTDRFAEAEAAGYTVCYSSGETAVFALREAFDAREGFGDLTVAEYGALVLANNGLDKTVTLEEADGLTSFGYEYTNPSTGETFYYYTVLRKGPDAFWMVQFTALAENARENLPQYRQWAKSIAFAA